jgi:hypothetical protein
MRPHNNKMQRTSHGQNGGSPLISVLCGRQTKAEWLNGSC